MVKDYNALNITIVAEDSARMHHTANFPLIHINKKFVKVRESKYDFTYLFTALGQIIR